MKLILDGPLEPGCLALLEAAANNAQEAEGIILPCCAHVTMTDDEGMKVINLEQRGIDETTDVLSFPCVNYPKGKHAGQAERLLEQEWDAQESASYLGDIVISLPRARAQADEYGHSFERELCYLLVHGLFHLFGYDHILEEEKHKMRQLEEESLAGVAGEPVADSALLQKAREAMTQAYVPYSRFRVGACLLAKDGKIYTGCNVENASFGLTNCAERTAVFKAVSEGAHDFSAIAIAAEGFAPWPCGACRQVLSEFAADMRVLVTWDNGKVEESTLRALLPQSFSPSNGVQDILRKVKQ